MALEPPIILGFVCVEVIQHHVNLAVWMRRHDLIHEVQKLSPASTLIVPRLHLPGCYVQGREQSRRTVALVAVAEAVDRRAIRQTEEALGPLQS